MIIFTSVRKKLIESLPKLTPEEIRISANNCEALELEIDAINKKQFWLENHEVNRVSNSPSLITIAVR